MVTISIERRTIGNCHPQQLLLVFASCKRQTIWLIEPHIDASSRCIRLPGPLNKNRKPGISAFCCDITRNTETNGREPYILWYWNLSLSRTTVTHLKRVIFINSYEIMQRRQAIDTKKTPVTSHRFSDYLCTNYLLDGGDLFTLQRIVAHADIKTTQGYIKLNEGAIRDSHALIHR